MSLKAEGCWVSLKEAAARQHSHGSLSSPLPRAALGCLPGAPRPAHVFASSADKCGDTIKILSPGYLTSPGYPQSYHPSQKCEWLIQAPEPYQRIMINFNPHFDLEDRDCK
uniref:CUB domain-containing protein n=1 Tax=Cyanistes caeruleus TaxID=156563 RepID=A0A8C0UF21_CYACU